jgi:hypothetical protein
MQRISCSVSASCSAVILVRPVTGSIFRRISAPRRRALELRCLSRASRSIEVICCPINVLRLRSLAMRLGHHRPLLILSHQLARCPFLLFKPKENCGLVKVGHLVDRQDTAVVIITFRVLRIRNDLISARGPTDRTRGRLLGNGSASVKASKTRRSTSVRCSRLVCVAIWTLPLEPQLT